MTTFDQFVTEQAESRREFLKKLGKGVAMATSGIKPDLSAVKKVANLSKPVIGHAPYDRDFDSYDAISYALDNMFEFARSFTIADDRYPDAMGPNSMPLDLQRMLGNKLQHMIIGHKYASSPGGPSSLRPTDYDFYSSLMDNADEYGDMEEAIASTSATLQDVFDYPKIFDGADKIWREKGRAGFGDIEKYIKDSVEGYIEADKKGDTSYEGEPEPVDEDPRDYLERDYASGPHMNSFKPELSFNQFYLTEIGSDQPSRFMRSSRAKSARAGLGKGWGPGIGKGGSSLKDPDVAAVLQDEQAVKKLYDDNNGSVSEIARQLSAQLNTTVDKTTVTRYFKMYGLPIYKGGLGVHSNVGGEAGATLQTRQILDNRDQLKFYHDKHEGNAAAVAKELGVLNNKTIIRYFRKHGLPVNPSGEYRRPK